MLASDDAAGNGVIETATFCRLNDDKRPGLIPAVPRPPGPTQVCPDDLSKGADEVTDTVPNGWYVRIQFDELLDTRVEDLIPIGDSGLSRGSLANSQPVTISCTAPGATEATDVPYDGYYDPSGNSFTWEVGPSLFVAPLDTSKVAAGSECQVSIKSDGVADKDGNPVPSDELGPYKFKIAALQLTATDPAVLKDPAMPATISPTKPLLLTFNATIAVDSLTAGEVTILSGVTSCTDLTGQTVGTAKIDPNQTDPADPKTINRTQIKIHDTRATGDNAWLPSTTYVVTFVAADVADLGGATLTLPGADKLSICFKTGT